MASFKTDESFLEKISLGAIGTQQVFQKLIDLGHQPIELERGSMNYKIWKKIKIKRIRVPDIICVDSGIRVESRAKSKLEITMSHSLNDPDRGWDAGLKDNDYVALISCKKGSLSPIDWIPDSLIHFVSVDELRKSYKRDEVVTEKAKGVQEGSEVRVTWPSCIAAKKMTIKEITDEKITSLTQAGRIVYCKLKRMKGGKPITLKPLVKKGDEVVENQIIASVVPIHFDIPRGVVNSHYFIQNLSNLNHSERYAAAKSLRYFKENQVILALKEKIASNDEHIYVRLEAAASLAILGEADGYTFIENNLKSQYLQNVLESVIVLNEIKSERACKLLCDILSDENFDPEIRAGAAWGLGEQQNVIGINAVVSSFNAVDESIRIEAARALAKLTKNFSDEILHKFITSTHIEKHGVAWALSRSNALTLDKLLDSIRDLDSRQWISYIIGTQGEDKFISEIEKIKLKDPEVYFAVTLLWKIMTSWIYDLKEY